LVFNAGERVEGYTNFLWVMINAAFMKSGIDPLTTSRAISVVSAVLIFFILYQISSGIFKAKGFIPFISIILLAFNPGFVIWTYSGMEMIFFTLLTTTGIYFILKFIQSGSWKFIYIANILFGISALTRPEGVLFFSLALTFLIYFLYFREYKNQKYSASLKKIILPVIIFLIIFLTYFFWRYDYYGYFFPNTFYAKTGIQNQQLAGLYYVYKFIRESLAYGLLLIFPLYFLIRNYRNFYLQFLIFIIVIYTSYIILIGGDVLLVQRFFIPIMPFIFLLVQQGISEFFRENNFSKIFKAAVIALVIFSTSIVVFDSRSFPMLGVKRSVDYCKNLATAGKWLKENADSNSKIAIESAGILPYYSELYTIDRLGLSNIMIAHSKHEGNAGSRVKSQDHQILAELKPDYYIDDFPTLNELKKSDTIVNNNVYRFNSLKIGTGEIEDKPGIVERGDLYFNFYKLEK
jgi:arabinofuranosyltransferase